MEEKNSLWKQYLEIKDPKSITIITECEIRFEEAQEKLSEIRRRILYHILNVIVKWSGTTLAENRSWDQGYWKEKNNFEKAKVLGRFSSSVFVK